MNTVLSIYLLAIIQKEVHSKYGDSLWYDKAKGMFMEGTTELGKTIGAAMNHPNWKKYR